MGGGIQSNLSGATGCFLQDEQTHCKLYLRHLDLGLLTCSLFSVANMIKKFITLYIPEPPKWDSVADLASSFEWLALTSNTTLDHFTAYGISETFTYEVVEAATRVNYGQVRTLTYLRNHRISTVIQNADELHALEGACSMATSGATGIQGGNFQLFEHFLHHSGASVHLNTTVNFYVCSLDERDSPRSIGHQH